jgi:arabinose-5-phosphate isomerase
MKRAPAPVDPSAAPVLEALAVAPEESLILASGRRTFQIEAQAISALTDKLDSDFVLAVTAILNTTGRVVLSGTGKSGLVARKIAATLAATGTPSFFMHATEALHGDLGMVASDDIVIAVSKSGEGNELKSLIPLVNRRCKLLIAIVGSRASTLARMAALVLDASVALEACPLDLTATASTTAALAMGDALAVALLHERGLGAADLAGLHPGGSLGWQLMTRVEKVMASESLPIVHPLQSVKDVILEMSRGRLGLAVVLVDGEITGIITDGDLRRAMDRTDRFLDLTAGDIMTAQPKWVGPEVLLVEAQRLMTRHLITSLLVSSDGRSLEGVVHIHHLSSAAWS